MMEDADSKKSSGRPLQMQAKSPEAAELAGWLQQLTEGLTIRDLAQRFDYNKTKWARFRNGSDILPRWLLEQLVNALIEDPQAQHDAPVQGRALHDRAQRAEPTARQPLPALSTTELRARLAEARRVQAEAHQTLAGTLQLVMMLGTLATQLDARRQQLEQRLHDGQAQLYRWYQDRAENQLARARTERDDAEDLRMAASVQTERYRHALNSEDVASPASFELRDTSFSDEELDNCEQLLDRSALQLDQARLALDDLRARLTPLVTNPRVIPGQLAKPTLPASPSEPDPGATKIPVYREDDESF